MKIQRPAHSLVAALALAVASACGAPNTPPAGDQPTRDDPEPTVDEEQPPTEEEEEEEETLVAPTVLESSPTDGQAGVADVALLFVKFSKPMNPSSVEAAFTTTSLPTVTFSWSDDKATVNITPVGGLQSVYGEGLDPSLVDALAYDFTIDGAAMAEDGTELGEAFTVSFTTQKLMLAVLPALADQTLTMLSTGVLHASNAESLYVGDSQYSAATQMKTFITFDLSAVPAGVVITDAAVAARQFEVNNDPYATLGTIQLEHVTYDAVGPDAFAAAARSNLGVFSSDVVIADKVVDVLDAFVEDYEARDALGNVSQYRLSFPLPHDGDDEGDSAELLRSSLKLWVTYQAD